MRPALPRAEFTLVFLVLLVVAAGNTALQSVLPALGRALKLPDIAVAVFFSLSAIVWTWSAPYWARRSDREGRKRVILVGLTGFVVATLIGGIIMAVGLHRLIGPVLFVILLAVARMVFGLFGSATMPASQAYVAARTSRHDRTAAMAQLASAFGLGTIIGPALAPFFVLPGVRLAGPLFVFAGIGLVVLLIVRKRLPDDSARLPDDATGSPAAMPSIGGAPSGASQVNAADGSPPRLSWRDPRIRPWIIFGALSANAQAASSQSLGFLVIDRLHMPPETAQRFIGIALMAGAAAALLAQWGLINTFDMKPRQLIRWGAAFAAAGLGLLAIASDYHAIVVAYGLTGLGFGFTRPGYTAGPSLSVSTAEQGAVAGAVTAINGGAFIFAPAIGIGLYELDPHAPFLLSALAMVGLFWFASTDKRLSANLDVRPATA